MKNKKQRILVFSLLAITAVFCIFIYFQNSRVTVSEHSIISNRIPKAFSDFKIVQVSDLHNYNFGKDNFKLLSKIKELSPNVIFITGDLIDRTNKDISTAVNFINKAVGIAPVYYVTGNHEATTDKYKELESALNKAGVKILENESTVLEKEGETITIAGIFDLLFNKYPYHKTSKDVIRDSIDSLSLDNGSYTLLLAHRPEFFEIYKEFNIDLVFSGHAHGGQIRLPFIGGILAPGQGLFPKYDGGLYTESNTNMIVSRGLGNSIFPIRINNPPEIVSVTLVCAE